MDIRDPYDYSEEDAVYGLTVPDSPDEVREVPLEDVPAYAHPPLLSSERAMQALEAAAASDASGLLGLRMASWRLRKPYEDNRVAQAWEELDNKRGHFIQDELVLCHVFDEMKKGRELIKDSARDIWLMKNPYNGKYVLCSKKVRHHQRFTECFYNLQTVRYGGKIKKIVDSEEGLIYYVDPVYPIQYYRVQFFTGRWKEEVVYILPDGRFILLGYFNDNNYRLPIENMDERSFILDIRELSTQEEPATPEA